MIKLTDVSKTYSKGSKPAVKKLNLTVPDGKIFGFLGPNGAGKSTTIKMIVGILGQDSGTIEVNGFDNHNNIIEIKRKIGFIPDESSFYDKMTAIRYLNFISDIFEVNEEDRKTRIEKYSKMFDLQDHLKEDINSYSHGMKQKLEIISAMVHDPEILILDEPMVGLDPHSSYVLKDLMREFCNEGKTVFFSTHVMEVAERLCDLVGIINEGELIAQGTYEELKNINGDKNATLEKLFLELTDDDFEE